MRAIRDYPNNGRRSCGDTIIATSIYIIISSLCVIIASIFKTENVTEKYNVYEYNSYVFFTICTAIYLFWLIMRFDVQSVKKKDRDKK